MPQVSVLSLLWQQILHSQENTVTKFSSADTFLSTNHTKSLNKIIPGLDI